MGNYVSAVRDANRALVELADLHITYIEAIEAEEELKKSKGAWTEDRSSKALARLAKRLPGLFLRILAHPNLKDRDKRWLEENRTLANGAFTELYAKAGLTGP